jgi:hypothetical protein
MVFSDESESSFLSRDGVEYLDERTVHEVNTEAEDIEIQSAHRIRGYDRRLGAGGNNAFQEVARCQVSQLYTSSRRALWVTRASHSR